MLTGNGRFLVRWRRNFASISHFFNRHNSWGHISKYEEAIDCNTFFPVTKDVNRPI